MKKMTIKRTCQLQEELLQASVQVRLKLPANMPTTKPEAFDVAEGTRLARLGNILVDIADLLGHVRRLMKEGEKF